MTRDRHQAWFHEDCQISGHRGKRELTLRVETAPPKGWGTLVKDKPKPARARTEGRQRRRTMGSLASVQARQGAQRAGSQRPAHSATTRGCQN